MQFPRPRLRNSISSLANTWPKRWGPSMSILVVGSVAFDTLKTPFGERQKVLGGAATYFALSASFFTQVRVVGVVGDDFTAEHEAVLTARGIDTRGIEHAH